MLFRSSHDTTVLIHQEPGQRLELQMIQIQNLSQYTNFKQNSNTFQPRRAGGKRERLKDSSRGEGPGAGAETGVTDCAINSESESIKQF